MSKVKTIEVYAFPNIHTKVRDDKVGIDIIISRKRPKGSKIEDDPDAYKKHTLLNDRESAELRDQLNEFLKRDQS